jgi:enterochelin esterase-like enzyme
MAALTMAMRHPAAFGTVFAQSLSFWADLGRGVDEVWPGGHCLPSHRKHLEPRYL